MDIPIDITTLLIFVMPGFFLVRAISDKKRGDFEYLMLSMFWGIILMAIYYKIYPQDKMLVYLNNPYAGAIIFSISAWAFGWLTKRIAKQFR